MNYKYTLLAIVLFLVTSSQSFARAWSVGVGAILPLDPYIGSQDDTRLFPTVNYEGKTLFLRGGLAGAKLLKRNNDSISAQLQLGQQYFKADDEDYSIEDLKSRKASVLMGLRYDYRAEWGVVRAIVSVDVSGNSKGGLGELAYGYSIQAGGLNLVPTIGVEAANEKYNAYYYGISSDESVLTGLDTYRSKAGVSTFVELVASYRFNQNWRSFLTARVTDVTREVKGSPLVKNRTSETMAAGILHTF